jgi:general secretion pathway protein H
MESLAATAMMPISRASASACKGFSLVELIVVMALVAMLTGLAAVSLGGRSEEGLLRRDAALAASIAAEARLRAISSGKPVELLVAPEADALFIPGSEPRGMRRGVTAALLNGERTAVDRISFYPGGGSSGGEIVLRSAAAGIAISIDWLTGEARISAVRAIANAR